MDHTIINDVEVFPMAVPPTGFGADAKNTNPVYSAAILKIKTNNPQLTGDSFVFTCGHGLLEMCDMIRSTARRFLLHGESPIIVEDLAKAGYLGDFSRMMLTDSYYNWLGGAGMSRMAIGAVNNALWDICAKLKKTTGWEFLARKTAEDLLKYIDFEHIGDFLTPAEAIQMLHDAQGGKEDRIAKMYEEGPISYNTAGWSGISTELLVAKTKDMLTKKWGQIKIKVGALFPTEGMEKSLKDDIARLTRIFNTIHESGGSMKVAVDSNQIFNVDDSVEFISRLSIGVDNAGQSKGAKYRLTWFEEPTNPIDSQGHLMIKHRLTEKFKAMGRPDLNVPIATGEHCPSPVIFKNLVKGIPECNVKPIDVIQPDYARVGGIGDSLASMMMARKAGVNVCPHAGGVGLCEGVVNIQALKEVLFGTRPGEVLEFVEGGLHEGVYAYPSSVKNSRYVMHRGAIGTGTSMTTEGEKIYRLPEGTVWQLPANKKLAHELVSNSQFLQK